MIHLSSITVFPNGMCMVFDTNGQQVPELQSTWEESKKKLLSQSVNTMVCTWYGVPFDDRLEIENYQLNLIHEKVKAIEEVGV